MDKKLRSPSGIYGYGTMDCAGLISPAPDVFVHTELTRNGTLVDESWEYCNIGDRGDVYCYSSVGVVSDRAGSQWWCVRVETDLNHKRHDCASF